MYYLRKQGNESVPRFYNRLDMNTSGIIVIAKKWIFTGISTKSRRNR